MRIRADQLAGALGRGLQPVYLVHGDEPLQREECLDAIRAAARAAGFSERIVLTVDGGFDWSEFRSHAESLSLFADRKIIDVRMPGASPGNEGAKVLTDYASRPAEDLLLVVSTGRLDRRVTNSKWFKSLDGAGANVPIFAPGARELPGWVTRRAAGRGLSLDREAAAVLAERSEGNLLACAQEIDKLRLLHPSGTIGVEEVLRTVSDSSRFGAFDLVDAALAGEAARSVRILRVLREEGVEPLQVLGSLTWAVRGFGEITERVEAGESVEDVLRDGSTYRSFWSRKGALEKLTRTRSSHEWAAILVEAEGADRVLKGALTRSGVHLAWRRGDGWDAVARICLGMCGVNPPVGPAYT